MKKQKHRIDNLFICIIGFIIVLILYLTSCKTKQHTIEHTTAVNTEKIDSTSRIERTNVQLLKIPLTTAALNLNLKNLNDLPVGAKYAEKQGQATVTVEKTGENDYKITATCDSLTRLIVERETEIFHLQSRVKELEENTSEVKETIVNETTGVRWFFIYSGYLLWGLFGCGTIYMLYKWRKKLLF